MLMHNSGRPTDGAVRASGIKRGNVLVGTEEEFTRPCEQSGKIVFSDLTDSWGGEPASKSSLTAPYRMKALDTFHPFIDTPETANPAAGCSAHYFEIEGSTLGAGWYGQGLRLLDISNARDVRQIGYYRVTGTGTDNPSSNSWDMAFKEERRKGDLLFLFDMSRGVEILRMKKGAYHSKADEVRHRAEREGGQVRRPAGRRAGPVADRERRHQLRLPAVPLVTFRGAASRGAPQVTRRSCSARPRRGSGPARR